MTKPKDMREALDYNIFAYAFWLGGRQDIDRLFKLLDGEAIEKT